MPVRFRLEAPDIGTANRHAKEAELMNAQARGLIPARGAYKQARQGAKSINYAGKPGSTGSGQQEHCGTRPEKVGYHHVTL